MSRPAQFKPIGAISEVMYMRDSDACSHTGYPYFVVKGKVELEAMRLAVRKMQESFPDTVSRVEERKIGLQHLLLRVPIEDPPGLEVIDDYAHDLGGLSVFDALKKIFEPRYTRRMDVHREVPMRITLVRLPEDRAAIVFFFHHIAADGATMMAVNKRLFSAYHEAMTGQAPDWAAGEDMTSSAGKATQGYSFMKVIRQMMAEGRLKKSHPVIRLGHDVRVTNSKRHMVRIMMAEDETRELVRKSKTLGVTVNDLLSVSIIRAVDACLGTPEGTFSFWLSTNVRGIKNSSGDQSNYTAATPVDLIRSERLDEKQLLHAFVLRRKTQMEMGRAYYSLKMLDWVLRFARLFPVAWRRPFLRRMLSVPITFMSSNIGAIFPKRVGGRLTADTYLTGAGGLEILDWDTNFTAMEEPGHELAAWTYLGKFNATFTVFEEFMERADAEKLMLLVRQELLR